MLLRCFVCDELYQTFDIFHLQVSENYVGIINSLFDAFSDDLLKFFEDQAAGWESV